MIALVIVCATNHCRVAYSQGFDIFVLFCITVFVIRVLGLSSPACQQAFGYQVPSGVAIASVLQQVVHCNNTHTHTLTKTSINFKSISMINSSYCYLVIKDKSRTTPGEILAFLKHSNN